MICAVLALTGCATKTRDFKLSAPSAYLSNVVIDETLKQEEGHHKISLSFDYSISEFDATDDAYFCSVQFYTKSETQTISYAGKVPPNCGIDSASGNASVVWTGPLDKSVDTPGFVEKLHLPIQYFVAIHQRTGLNKSKIIGSSKTFQSLAQ
jgi:hypothetical protein